MLPWTNLQLYQNVVGNPLFTTSKTQQPYYQPSTGSQVAGGLLGLAGTAAQFLPYA